MGAVPRKQRLWRRLGAGCIVSALAAATALAQQAVERPAETLDPAAAKARVVLERHCARCHEAGQLKSAGPAADLGHILDVARLADDPSLVVPGNADASPLYTLMLRREMPPDVDLSAASEQIPSAVEISAVRDWIDGLPVEACASGWRPGPADLAAAIEAAIAAEGDAARELRFVSLAHLDGGCTLPATLAAYREAATALMSSLGSAAAPARLSSLAGGRVLQVRLGDLGWSAAEWDILATAAGTPPAVPPLPALLAARTGTTRPLLPADWLAVHARSPAVLQQLVAQPERRDGVLQQLSNEPVAALARAYRGPVTIARASAETGEAVDALKHRLASLDSAFGPDVIRMDRSGLPRPQAERLYAVLAGRAAAAPQPAAESAVPQTWDLTLVSDKASYRVHDVATFTVHSPIACNLTLISVNAAGKATVVFPNDFEPDNVLAAGQTLRIPAENAPYRLRLAEAGRERMIAVCMARSKMADAIVQDYERQRFTALGHWGNFLFAMLEAEEKGVRPEDRADPKAKGRTAARAKDKDEMPRRILREPQARTAITLRVDP
jgi:hypothetical protein